MTSERWRFITPVLLCVLSGLITISVFVQNDIRNDIRELRSSIEETQRELSKHVISYGHQGVVSDLAWIKDYLKRRGFDSEG